MPPLPRSQSADEVASNRVDAQLAALLAALQSEQQASDRQAAARAAQIQGLTQAEANMLRTVGPAVDQTYKSASDDTSAYAKAYAMGAKASEEKAQAEANQLLAKNNAPSGQMLRPSGVDQVLYGTEGYIPASTLRAQGAAFSSAAHMMPQVAFGRGQMSLGAAQAETAERNQQLRDKRLEVEAQRPGLLQQALAEIRKNNLERQAMGAQAKQSDRDYRLKSRAQNLNEQLAVANLGLKQSDLGLKQTSLKLKAQNQRFSQQTKRAELQLKRLQNDRSWQGELGRLGVSEGNLQLRAAELEIKRRNKGKTGGFTANQMKRNRAEAGDIARGATTGGVDPETGQTLPKLSYQAAIREMLSAGIPLATAQQALNRYWTRPGQTMPWEQKGNGRPYVKLQTRQKQAKKRRSR